MTSYVYRLECIYDIWGRYFEQDRPYPVLSDIDDIDSNASLPVLPSSHGWCGLWFLEDLDDAITFQKKEPPGKEVSFLLKSVVLALQGRGSLLDHPMRLLTRIDRSVFLGRGFFPDLPLVHMYQSSKFDLHTFDPKGHSIFPGRVTFAVTLPRNSIEVFYDGAWIRKSPQAGNAIRTDILRRDSAAGIMMP